MIFRDLLYILTAHVFEICDERFYHVALKVDNFFVGSVVEICEDISVFSETKGFLVIIHRGKARDGRFLNRV